MKATFNFESIGRTHPDEAGFFKYLIADRLGNLWQFCTINGLSVTVDSLTPEVVFWAYSRMAKDNCIIITPTGYEYTITSINA